MPFLLDDRRYVASSHLLSGTFERSNRVPTVTVKFFRQELHWISPARVLLPCKRWTFSHSPQCGQNGPCGQLTASRCSRALSALVKMGLVRSNIGHFLLMRPYPSIPYLRQVYNCRCFYKRSLFELRGFQATLFSKCSD